MQLGMIGLGRMGASMGGRLMSKGHACVVHDTQPAEIARLQEEGGASAPRRSPNWFQADAAALDLDDGAGRRRSAGYSTTLFRT
jgi:3-hydroxyisobutyrate dehydrogenase-like beta-hydroxyacid dehydrogenase